MMVTIEYILWIVGLCYVVSFVKCVCRSDMGIWKRMLEGESERGCWKGNLREDVGRGI